MSTYTYANKKRTTTSTKSYFYFYRNQGRFLFNDCVCNSALSHHHHHLRASLSNHFISSFILFCKMRDPVLLMMIFIVYMHANYCYSFFAAYFQFAHTKKWEVMQICLCKGVNAQQARARSVSQSLNIYIRVVKQWQYIFIFYTKKSIPLRCWMQQLHDTLYTRSHDEQRCTFYSFPVINQMCCTF